MSVAVAGTQQPHRSALARTLGTLVLAVLAVLLPGVPAFAHADLLETTPADGAVLDAAPATVELRFNEPVQVVDGGMLLFPGGGDPTVLTAKTVNSTVAIELPESGLEPNAYTLAYRVVSADGHPVGGAVSFQVGDGEFATADPAAPRDPRGTETIVSALTGVFYAGLLALAGLVLFDVVIAGTGHPGSGRTRVLARIAYAAAIAASGLLIPAAAARVLGIELVSYLGETGELLFAAPSDWLHGVSWPPVVTAVSVLVSGAVTLALHARAARGTPARLLALASALVTVSTPVLVGHTQTVSPMWAMFALDLAHLFTGAFWIGGVLGLISMFAASPSTRHGARPAAPADQDSPEASAGARRLVAAVSRFSRYAVWSVALLAASGTVMGVLIVGSLDSLFTSTYGVLLLGKLGVVAIVVVLAAVNRYAVLPKLAGGQPPKRQLSRLRRTLVAEAALLAAVVAVTGVLTNTSPGTDARRSSTGSLQATPEVPFTASSQGLTVDGVLTQGASQQATLTFTLEFAGEPVTGADVSLEARQLDQDLGPFTATPVVDAATGSFTATLALPAAGQWQLQFAARVDTYSQPLAVALVEVP